MYKLNYEINGQSFISNQIETFDVSKNDHGIMVNIDNVVSIPQIEKLTVYENDKLLVIFC